MAIKYKMIAVDANAYDLLKSLKKPSESFGNVLCRLLDLPPTERKAGWPLGKKRKGHRGRMAA